MQNLQGKGNLPEYQIGLDAVIAQQFFGDKLIQKNYFSKEIELGGEFF